MPVIPIPGKLRQEHHSDLKANMYRVFPISLDCARNKQQNGSLIRTHFITTPLVYPVLACCL